MSDQPTPPIEQPFNSAELKQFDQDDAKAGSAIGRLLTIFFLYTVVAMIGSCAVTWYWISKASGQ